MPAHITALFPFLAQRRLRRDLVAELKELCSSRPALEVVFRRTARFDEVLYLQPEPAEGLRQLTLAIAGRWPEAPPYGGRFKEIVPHLTVAHGADEKVLDAVEAELTSHLPLAARLPEAVLYGFDGRCWREHTRLPFSDADAGEGAAPTEAVAGSPEPSTG
jgi:2'-5' RNA ligase